MAGKFPSSCIEHAKRAEKNWSIADKLMIVSGTAYIIFCIGTKAVKNEQFFLYVRVKALSYAGIKRCKREFCL